ncbi:MAG: hypothetical protein Q8P32_04820 [Candidatus Komeilibacteria bacterium]|nr:hypothetical protein [Candidatus Komeilibacteria bacterium]
MRNFQLADNLHSFCLRQSCSCCSGSCDSNKSSLGKKQKSVDYFDHLFKGTYVMCSCLIVYSLLVINFLAISDPVHRDPIGVALQPVAQVGAELYYNAMYIGDAMGNPLEDTIEIYTNSLISLFQNTGEVLSKIPDMLTWAPPVQARTMNNYYW